MPAKHAPIVGSLNHLANLVPLSTPFSIAMPIGNTCDFSCCYCGLRDQFTSPDFRPYQMSLDEFSLIAAQVREFDEPLKLFTFVSQGETLLNPELPEMIHMIKKTGKVMSVKVVSNGSHLTPQLSDRLVAAGLDMLKISLQGLSTQKYREICHVAPHFRFETFVDQIRYFYEHRDTCKLHLKIIDLALEEGEHTRFYELFDHISDYLFIETADGDRAAPEYQDENRFGLAVNNMQICPLPFYTMSLDLHGNVAPCCLKCWDIENRNICMGNIQQMSLKDIWNTSFRALQQDLLKKSLSKQSECYGCTLFRILAKEEDHLDSHAAEIIERMEA